MSNSEEWAKLPKDLIKFVVMKPVSSPCNRRRTGLSEMCENTRCVRIRKETFLPAHNKRLTPEQALHLAGHGVKRNVDGSYSWKFDEYQRARAPYRLSPDDHIALWSRITRPTLLLRGKESFLPDPETAGVPAHFRRARFATIVGAGHWLHHDKLDEVLGELCPFLGI